MSVCDKCKAYIDAKSSVIKADKHKRNKDYKLAGEEYLKAVEHTPRLIDGDYKVYIVTLLKKAENSFSNIRNNKGLEKVSQHKHGNFFLKFFTAY